MAKKRKPLDPPTNEELECLICWPKGSVGYIQEYDMVRQLKRICDTIGYGRTQQLMEQISALWRSPELVKEYGERRDKHLNMIMESRRTARVVNEKRGRGKVRR